VISKTILGHSSALGKFELIILFYWF